MAWRAPSSPTESNAGVYFKMATAVPGYPQKTRRFTYFECK
ncbi:Hypothetical protein FORC64_p062 (plasmid) [Escherichia coli]|nr:Hypothetical protein FORC64_p062 [Escherichia coli]